MTEYRLYNGFPNWLPWLALPLIALGAFLSMNPNRHERKSQDQTEIIMMGNLRLQCVKIDDCEYLFYYGGMDDKFLTHKGDCKNPIHFYRSEIDDQFKSRNH